MRKAKAKRARRPCPLRGVTAHGDPCGTLQFFRLEVILGRPIFCGFAASPWHAINRVRGITDESSMKKITRLLIGAAGGVAGAALMGEAYKLTAKLVDAKPAKGEDATEKVANSVATKFTGRKLRSPAKRTGGQIVHYAFGASMGMLYASLADAFPSATAGCGALFGLSLYAGAHGLAVPALGLAPNPLENGAARESAELSSHIAFGLTTEALRRLLTRQL